MGACMERDVTFRVTVEITVPLLEEESPEMWKDQVEESLLDIISDSFYEVYVSRPEIIT